MVGGGVGVLGVPGGGMKGLGGGLGVWLGGGCVGVDRVSVGAISWIMREMEGGNDLPLQITKVVLVRVVLGFLSVIGMWRVQESAIDRLSKCRTRRCAGRRFAP